MKKTIVIVSSILAFFAVITAALVAIDYKMKHRRYISPKRS